MDRNELASWIDGILSEHEKHAFTTVPFCPATLREIRDALRQSAWRPMSEAPETGVLLVLLEKEMLGSRVHTANWRPNVKIIGGVFSYDAPRPIAWMEQPLPPPPSEGVEG